MSVVCTTRSQLVEELLRHVARGVSCVLLGPRRRGKTQVLRCLHDRLQDEIGSAGGRALHSVLLTLEEGEGGAWSFAEVVGAIAAQVGGVRSPVCGDLPLAEQDALLEGLLTAPQRRVAVLLSPVEAVEEGAVARLLQTVAALGKLPDNGRPVLVVAGGAALASAAPPGYARFFLDCSGPEEARCLTRQCAEASGGTALAANLVEAVADYTGGEPALIRLVLDQLRQPFRQPDLAALDAFRGELRNTFSNAVAPSSTPIHDRRQCRKHPGYAALRETLEEIRNRPAWMLLVGCLCTGPDLLVEAAPSAGAEFCLALRRQGQKVTFANPLFEEVLRNFFVPVQIADALVLRRHWADARPFYRLARQDSLGEFSPDLYTLTELVHHAAAALVPDEDVHGMAREVGDVARCVLGVQGAVVLRGQMRQPQQEWTWTELARVGSVPDDPFRLLGLSGWAIPAFDSSLRQDEVFPLHGGMHLLAFGLQASTRAVALYTASNRRQSSAQQRATRALCDRLVALANEAESLACASRTRPPAEPPRPLSRRSSVAETAQDVLTRFTRARFPDVLLALVDESSRVLRGTDATGRMAALARQTLLQLEPDGPEEHPLLAVLRADRRCEVSGSLVFPLRGPRKIAGGAALPFGVLQVGNVCLPLAPARETALNELVGEAARELYEARVFEQRNYLLELRDRQVRLMKKVAAILAEDAGEEQALANLLHMARDSFQARTGCILLLDRDLGQLVCRAVAGDLWQRDIVMRALPIDYTSTTGWVFQEKKARLNPTLGSGVPYCKNFEVIQSNCGVPIRIQGTVEGALILEADRPAAFTVGDVDLLEAFASLLGAWISNRRALVLDQTRAQLFETVKKEADPDRQFHQVAQIARQAIGADHCSLFLRSASNSQRFLLLATTAPPLADLIRKVGYRLGEDCTGWVAQHGTSIRYRVGTPLEDLTQRYKGLRPTWRLLEYGEGVHPDVDFLAVPVRGEQECWGTLRAVVEFTGRPEQLFTPEDREVLELIGRELGAVLDWRHQQRQRLREKEESEQRALRSTTERVAHKLKNPASFLLLAARNCQEDLAARNLGTIAERLDWIAGYAERIMQVTDHVTQFLIPPQVHRVPLDLPALVRAVVSRATEGTHYQAVVPSPPPWPTLQLDRSLCLDILEELVRNAQLAMPEGGKIGVEYTGPYPPQTGPFPTMPGSYVTLVLYDTGPGVPAPLKEEIFLPYKTTRTDGTGLGLANVRNAVRAQGGEIREDGPTVSEGRGARFRIAFPLPTAE
jgi:signal transduction histidine kinase